MQKIRPLTIERWRAFQSYAKQQLEETSSFRPYLFKDDAEFNPKEGEYHYVLLDGDNVYGYFFVEKSGDSADVGYGVLESYKGHGWGTKMMDEIMNLVRSIGVRTVEATADMDNYRSILLLYKFGFRVYGERDDNGIKCVAMRKIL